MNGKAMYIKPTSLLMPVGYNSKNVLYLRSEIFSQSMSKIRLTQYYTSGRNLYIQISYLSHKNQDGVNPKASLNPKKE